VRLSPPSWRDRRLVVGVLLVVLAVAATTAVITRSDDTTAMYAARHVLVPGQALTAADVQVVRVRLGAVQDHYLAGRRPPPAGAVVLRTVPAGELVPVAAVGRADQVDVRPVSLTVGSGTAHDLRAGALVDVWVAAGGPRSGTFATPVKLVSSATVASVVDDGGALSGDSTAAVDVLLDEVQIPQILAAVDSGARISLVPLPGSVPRGGS
jgi:hypothetical protein